MENHFYHIRWSPLIVTIFIIHVHNLYNWCYANVICLVLKMWLCCLFIMSAYSSSLPTRFYHGSKQYEPWPGSVHIVCNIDYKRKYADMGADNKVVTGRKRDKCFREWADWYLSHQGFSIQMYRKSLVTLVRNLGQRWGSYDHKTVVYFERWCLLKIRYALWILKPKYANNMCN